VPLTYGPRTCRFTLVIACALVAANGVVAVPFGSGQASRSERQGRETCLRPSEERSLLTDAEGFFAYPGTVELQFSDARDANRVEALAKSYGLSCPQSIAHEIDGAVVPSGIVCHVPTGHECAWITILRASSLIKRAVLRRAVTASVSSRTGPISTESSPGPYSYRRQVPFDRAALASPPRDVLKGVESFLRARFQGRGRVTQGHGSPATQVFLVEDLRGEIVKQHAYWEKLEVTSVVDAVRSVVFIVDGYYSAGVGSRPPSSDAFISMERQYYRELHDYTGGMTRELEDYFQQPR
jgi:hypothetical protein